MSTRSYEIVVIFDPSLDDQAVNEAIKRTGEQIKQLGGTAGKVERWGRRKLAYPIDKKTDGFYAVIEATGEPSRQAELDRSLFLADDVLRHKILRTNPRAAAERTIGAPPAYEEIVARAAGERAAERAERAERNAERGDRGRRSDRSDRGESS